MEQTNPLLPGCQRAAGAAGARAYTKGPTASRAAVFAPLRLVEGNGGLCVRV